MNEHRDPATLNMVYDSLGFIDMTAYNALKRCNLTTLPVIAAETFEDLIAIRNLGVKRLVGIANMLKHYGFEDAAWIRDFEEHMQTHKTLPKYGR